MAQFIITPTNIDYLGSVFRNPLTGKWTIPIFTFNTKITNPFFGEIDPLNEDPTYQREVANYFYTGLKEKWLYKDPAFRKLLKYFVVEENGDEGKVYLVPSMDKVSKSNVKDKYRKHVFKYIEKLFLTKKFVRHVLREFVRKTKTKWYDLFNNKDTLKELFAKKLKKEIVDTIYELENKLSEKNDKLKS